MKIKIYSILTTLFVLTTIIPALSADSGKIIGYVLDSKNGEPLVGANVFIQGTYMGASTDVEGQYYISNVPPGDYTLSVTYIGYQDKKIKISLKAGEVLKQNIKLDFQAIEGEVIEVTVQAEGQMGAINQQIASNKIVSIVSSSRIRELPDVNAAESVSRLPGVSVKRSAGEGNKVVIRGLSPKYNTINISGVKMPSTGSGDRSTDISMISPYMLNGIEVTKAITPDQEADVIGGSVNFKLKKAPKGFKIDGIAQGGYNGLEGVLGDYKFVVGGSNRFFDDKLGLFIQGDVERRNRSADVLNAGHDIVNPSLDTWDKVIAISSAFRKQSRNRQRYGGAIVLDYNLGNSGSITLNNFVSQSKTDNNVQAESFNAQSNSHSYSISDNGNNLLLLNNSLNFEYDFGLFKLNTLLANSYAENETPLNMSVSFLENAAFTNASGLENPFSLVDSAKNDLQNTYLNNFSAVNSYNKENQYTAAADVEFNLALSKDISSKIKLGGKYRHINKYNNAERYFRQFQPYRYSMDSIRAYFPWMNSVDVGSAIREKLPYQLFIDPHAKSRKFLDGQFDFGPQADFELMRELYYMLINTPDNVRQGLEPGTPLLWKDWQGSIQDDYNGTEDYSAGYIMAEFNLGRKFMILPGVRYERNITRYTASRGDNTELNEVGYNYYDTTTTRINDYWLPMLHLKYKPTTWLDLRFAYTNTLSRPNFSRIVPGWHLNTTSGVLSYNNYQLEPGHSTNFDLSASVYENHVGFFTLGLFYKKIDNLIYNPGRMVIRDPKEWNLPSNLGAETISTTINNKYSAEIKGIELDWQTHFWYLPGALNGFVLNVNYTHIQSETKYPKNFMREVIVGYDTTYVFGQIRILPIWETVNIDSFYTGRVVDQPKDIINISFGYDYRGFSGRISMQYTDNILARTNFWEELTAITDTYIRWDLALKQELPVKGLQIYYNLNNFTRAVDRSLILGNKFPSSEEYYDMSMALGVRYRF